MDKRGYDRIHKYSLTMKADTQITCGAAEADVAGNHVVLPCNSILLGITASALGGAGLLICPLVVYHGTTKSGVAASAALDVGGSSSQNSDTAEPAAAYVGKHLPKGTEFCLSENGTNTKTADQLQVTLWLQDLTA